MAAAGFASIMLQPLADTIEFLKNAIKSQFLEEEGKTIKCRLCGTVLRDEEERVTDCPHFMWVDWSGDAPENSEVLIMSTLTAASHGGKTYSLHLRKTRKDQ